MEEPTIWKSSKGILYTKSITRTSWTQTLAGVINNCGVMEHLEELTIIGKCASSANTWQNGSSSPLWKTNFPNLKKLILKPTENAYPEGQTGGYFKFGHYAFTGLPDCVEYIELGSLQNEGLYFYGAGYFRSDMPVPPGTSAYSTGTAHGLTLVVYRPDYKANGGFGNGIVAPNTTIICRNYITGEIMTA